MLIQNAVADAINNTEWVFPTAECFHIAAFALSIGTIAIVDLRMLGLGMKRQTAAQLARDTAPWTLIGLVIVILSGMVLFMSDMRHYIYNGSFEYKVTALVVAILFNYLIHGKVASSGKSSPGLSKVVGLVSLALWVSVVAGGLFIAFV